MKIVKTSLDLGNSMLKGATYIDGKAIVCKLPNKIQFNKTVNPKARVFEIDGNIMYVGVGKLNNNVLKHTRKYLLEQALVMIHELYPNDSELKVDLKLGLPPEQLFNDSYLKEYENLFPTSKVFNYSVGGTSKKVTINSVEVFAEGYSAFVNLVDEITSKQDIISIDVGGGTTDLCNYSWDYEDEMYYPDETYTIKKGIINFSEEIAKYFNNKESADIQKEFIDNLLKNDIEVIEYEGKEFKLSDYLVSLSPMIDDMMNDITNKFGKLDRYIVVGIGGGYKTFNRMMNNQIKKEIEIDSEKQFYANALGYLEQ
nr:MAG: StbA protein [Bacteriophage sp.]